MGVHRSIAGGFGFAAELLASLWCRWEADKGPIFHGSQKEIPPEPRF